MKAAICYETGKPLVIEEIEMAAPKEHEVKVKVVATAICHSDLHDIKGDFPGPTPFIGGHETAGYVDEVGSAVTSVKKGDAVIVSLLASCGQCHYCLIGLPSQCEKMGPGNGAPPARLFTKKKQVIEQKGGVAGFAEYVLVNDSQLVSIPKDMPLDRACLLACGVITGFGGVVFRAQVKPFQSVAVIGTGGVGLNALQGAAFSGAYPIFAVDILDKKLEASRQFGATHVINSSKEDPAEAIRKVNHGRGADWVFVTVGSIGAIKQSIGMLGTRGTSVIIGLPAFKDLLTFSPLELVRFEKTLTGGFMGATNLKIDMPRLIELYQTKQLKLDELVSNRYPFSKINEAIASTGTGEILRNVIVF